MSVIKKNLIDDKNLFSLLKSIFSMIEEYYLPRTKHNETVLALDKRLSKIEPFINYKFSLVDGNLLMTVANESVNDNIVVNNSGNLILTLDDDETSMLECFGFYVSNNELYETQTSNYE